MGCPGQARTKPRSKIQPSQQYAGDRRRTAAAAANKSHAALGRTLVATRAARPRQGGAQPRPTIATMLRKAAGQRARPVASNDRPARNNLRGQCALRRVKQRPAMAQQLRKAVGPSAGHRAASAQSRARSCTLGEGPPHTAAARGY
ncbi:hypothetical protein F511_22289 [Dorcoceras hygrometricum]|uniref:Uncharacterized protein n=1 Tax=Dorcoceras hygrometricum TaxID=472368 RepID=A0A2Z7DE60_9LAMI|nr:hypothetical protein F511_22289 [Dorcoceras hygrometricum]